MKNVWLLPKWCRPVGCVILIPCAIVGILYLADLLPDSFLNSIQCERIFNNVLIIGTMLGLYMVVFSREKIEDEMVVLLRSNAMIKSFILYFGIFVAMALAVYDLDYLTVMWVTPYIIPLLYVSIFRYSMYKHLRENE